MSLPKIITYIPSALDRDGIALAQAAAGAGSLTLNGTKVSGGVATMGDQQFISVYSGANISSRVFTITGKDRWDNTITETVTGVNASTVSTTKSFYKVSSVAIDGSTSANNVEVGFTGLGYSVPLLFNRFTAPFSVGMAIVLTSGSGTFQLQSTYDDIQTPPNTYTQHTATWLTHATLTSLTASTEGALTSPVMAVRLQITTSGSTPLLALNAIQAGL